MKLNSRLLTEGLLVRIPGSQILLLFQLVTKSPFLEFVSQAPECHIGVMGRVTLLFRPRAGGSSLD